MRKEASEAGAALAREISERVATLTLDTGMKKQANTAGEALAKALLLQKQANTSNGVDPTTAVPTKIVEDNAAMEAEGDMAVKPLPTGDGVRNYGSVNQIFDAIIQDALSQGAASNDQVHERGVAKVEGEVKEHAVPNEPGVLPATDSNREVEKVAAIVHLVNSGVNFEDAVLMVKQAEQEIEDDLEKAAALQTLLEEGVDYEQAVGLINQASVEIEKKAAFDRLVQQGVDFDKAVELIKQANTSNGVDPTTAVPTKIVEDNAAMEAEGDMAVKPLPTGDGVRNYGSVNQIFDAIIQDALSQGAASNDQVHERGVAKVEGEVKEHAVPNEPGVLPATDSNREVEKVAAINKLVEAGINFDEAVNMVKQAASVAGVIARLRGAAGPVIAKSKSMIGGAANTAKELAKPGINKVKSLADDVVVDAGLLRNPTKYGKNVSRMSTVKSLAKNPLVYGSAAGLGTVGAAAALSREKQAAVNQLVEAGVDFDQAVTLVNNKAKELYRE